MGFKGVNIGGVICYEDGSQVTEDGWMHFAVPDDPGKLAYRLSVYWAALVKRLEADISRLDAERCGAVFAMHPRDFDIDAEIVHLKAILEVARQCQADVAQTRQPDLPAVAKVCAKALREAMRRE